MFGVLRKCHTAPFSKINKSGILHSSFGAQQGALRLLQTCSTKLAAEPVDKVKPAVANSGSTWNTIYHFPGIVLTASLKRLKLYPVGLTATTVPICLGLAYADIFSVTTAQICGSIGLTTTLTLLLFSYTTNNLVGYVYTDNDCKQVRISYVDFGGKRQEQIYSIDDIVPRSELGRSLLKFYFPIKNHDNKDVYRIVHKYGEIYNEEAFQKVFGKD